MSTKPRIDPMQDPFRPGYFMNYAPDETPAEMVLRKLACWLGVGGYNADKVDAELFHRKIVEGIQDVANTERMLAAQVEQEPSLTDAEIDAIWEGLDGKSIIGNAWPGEHLTLLNRAFARAVLAAHTGEAADRSSLPATGGEQG